MTDGFTLPDPIEIETRHWFALQVRSGSEFTAGDTLHDYFHIYPYVPYEHVWGRESRHTKKRVRRRVALLPGYILGGFTESPPRWYDLYLNKVITGVLGWEGRPIELRWQAIWELMQLHGSGAFDAPEHQQHMAKGYEFEVGDHVKIVKGPLEGIEVTVAQILDDRARVVFHMLGEQRAAELNVGTLIRME